MGTSKVISLAKVREEVLGLARQARGDLFQESRRISSLLRTCLTIRRLLDTKIENSWIELELDGYFEKFPTNEELMENLPMYRKLKMLYYDEYNNPVLMSEEMAEVFQNYPFGNSASEIEASKELTIARASTVV